MGVGVGVGVGVATVIGVVAAPLAWSLRHRRWCLWFAGTGRWRQCLGGPAARSVGDTFARLEEKKALTASDKCLISLPTHLFKSW